MAVKTTRYGWRRDRPDFRDLRASAPAPVVLSSLPAKVDLRGSNEPPIYDQGDLGSCTANAIAALYQAELGLQGLPVFTPSRLFIYYNERVMEGDVDQDNGAQLRDGFKAVAQLGACPEPQWPYDTGRFAVKPGADCYAAAKNHLLLNYLRLTQDLGHLKACLAIGRRFAVGISVYDSFESDSTAKTGVVTMPRPDEGFQGGHAVAVVGYDDSLSSFIVRNSWGPGWGAAGYFYLPYSYMTNPDLAADFWTMVTLE